MEAPAVRLVAVDLDGTLLRDGGTSPEDTAALIEALQHGLTVCIATGRPHRSALLVLDELGLPPLPVISFNGAMVRLPGAEQPLLHVTMPADLAREVVQAGVEERWHLHYFLGDDLYVTRMSKMAWGYWRRTGIRPTPVGDLRKLTHREPTKIILVEEPERVDSIAPQMARRWDGRLYVARSRPDIVELVSPSANKGAALRHLAQHLGYAPEETLAIGDAANDVPLIEAAGLGVAMPGSDAGVLAVADVVLGASDAPIAEAVCRLALGQD